MTGLASFGIFLPFEMVPLERSGSTRFQIAHEFR
jgi:hypothetical protein